MVRNQAGTPDPLINSRAAYAALRARMSHKAAGETIGHTDGTRLSCGATLESDDPTAPSTRATSGRHVTPHPSTPSQLDAVCETGIFTKQEIISINHTRHSIRVHSIGDMTYSDGLSLDPTMYTRRGGLSDREFPLQHPTGSDHITWLKAIGSLTQAGKKLRRPLGKYWKTASSRRLVREQRLIASIPQGCNRWSQSI